jgi:hypothetical protein
VEDLLGVGGAAGAAPEDVEEAGLLRHEHPLELAGVHRLDLFGCCVHPLPGVRAQTRDGPSR